MDKLKQYIQNHREELDEDVPDMRIWDAIESTISTKEKSKIISFHVLGKWLAAASIVCICAVSYWLFSRQNNTPPIVSKPLAEVLPRVNHPAKTQIKDETEILPKEKTETAKVEWVKSSKPRKTFNRANMHQKREDVAHFQTANIEIGNFEQVINYQKQYINSIPIYSETADYYKDFKTQLHQMDKDEKSIRNDIKNNGLTPDELNQLITVYQQKINVLKQLYNEINRTNTAVQQQSGKKIKNNSQPHYLNL